MSADPDGDGRDGVLVATYEGATLIDGTRRTTVLRDGPAVVDGKEIPAKWRHARPAGAADFGGDGKDELVLNWGADAKFGTYGAFPTRWWLTDGTTTANRTTSRVGPTATRATPVETRLRPVGLAAGVANSRVVPSHTNDSGTR